MPRRRVLLSSTTAACLLVLALIRAVQAAPGELDGSYLNELEPRLVTPHFEFAKPAAAGKVRVMFVVPWFLAAREVVEVAQRLDIDYDVVTTSDSKRVSRPSKTDPTALVAGTRLEDKEERMLATLRKPHDVIVLGNFQFSSLPESVQKEIEKQVRAGTGLLLTYRHELPDRLWEELQAHPEETGRDWISKGVPLADLKYFPGRWHVPPKQDQLGTYALGDGRVALVDYKKPDIGLLDTTRQGGESLTAPTIFNFRLMTAYRYYLSLPTRAMLWAAGRVPAVRFDMTSPVICADEPPKLTAKILVPEALEATVEVLVRDIYGRNLSRQSRPATLKPGRNEIGFTLPSTYHGVFFADLWVKTRGETLDWSSVAIRAGTAILKGIELKQRWCQAGQPWEATVHLRRELRPDERVELWLKDSQDRILQKQPAESVVGTKAPVKLVVRATPSMLMRPEPVVLANGKLVDRMENPAWTLYVPRGRSNRFHFVVWGQNSSGMPAYWAYQTFRDLGADAILRWPRWDHDKLLSALDMTNVAHYFRTNVHNRTGAKYEHRYLPRRHAFPFEAWAHPEDRKAYLEDWSQQANQSWHTGILSYSLGDEIKLGGRDVGFSDWWMPGFRAHLRKVYPSIDALNDSWQTQYDSFDDVRPLRSNEVVTAAQVREKAEATGDRSWGVPSEGNTKAVTYAPYLDHRRYVCGQFAAMLTQLQETLHAVDPKIRVGFEGSGVIETYYGIELPTVARVTDMWGPYYRRSVNEVIRCFKRDEMIFGNWSGGYVHMRKDPLAPRHIMWDMLLGGCNTLLFFATGSAEGGLNTDLSPAPHVPVHELKQIAGGLGEWLAGAEIDEDPIALMFSETSNQITSFERPWGHYQRVHDTWLALLWDLGLTGHYLDEVTLSEGELNSRPYRVLILPSTLALSKAEAKQVRMFVDKGGWVLADLRPGVTNEHGRYLPAGQVDDLFGIRRSTTSHQTRSGPMRALHAGSKTQIDLSRADVDPTVEVTTGQAVDLDDGVPVIIVNRHGKGGTVLLNFSIFNYLVDAKDNPSGRYFLHRRKQEAGALAKLIEYCLAEAGVRPRVRVSAGQGGRLPTTRCTVFRLGNTHLLGILKSPQKDISGEGAEVRLSRRYWVYDVLKGKPIGHTDQFTSDLAPAAGRFYALLDCEMQDLSLELDEPVQLGGDLAVSLTLTVNGTMPSRSLVRLEVFDPRGRACRHFHRFVWLDDGSARVELPIAFDEKPGVYRVVATDVLTGTRAAGSFTCRSSD